MSVITMGANNADQSRLRFIQAVIVAKHHSQHL